MIYENKKLKIKKGIHSHLLIFYKENLVKIGNVDVSLYTTQKSKFI